MPDITTYADTFRTWRGLIAASVQHADKVPGVEPFKADLEASLARAEELKTQQETLESTRLEATKNFAAVLQEGKEKVRKLQSFIKSVLGTRSELLKQFGLVPNRLPRPRSRKSRKQPPTPAEGQPANPPAPAAATADPAPAAKPGF
jgi:DNA-binding protein H-NS